MVRGGSPGQDRRGRRISFVLGRCPFADVAATEPDTVCQLHLGLARTGRRLGGLEVERLMVKDAHRAGCQLIMRRSPAAAVPA